MDTSPRRTVPGRKSSSEHRDQCVGQHARRKEAAVTRSFTRGQACAPFQRRDIQRPLRRSNRRPKALRRSDNVASSQSRFMRQMDVDEFHHQVVGSDVVKLADMRVVQRGHSPTTPVGSSERVAAPADRRRGYPAICGLWCTPAQDRRRRAERVWRDSGR
jgi:hypothetical protein